MKKILLMVVGILLVIGLVAGGTIAYFSDTEETLDNVIQAGTIDLEMSVDGPDSLLTFTFLDIKPCEDLEPIIIKLENVGQNNGYLYQQFTYVNSDKTPEGEFVGDITADEFAALIYVESIMYQHLAPGYVGTPHNDLPDMMAMNANGDGYLSLYEMKGIWMPYSKVYPEDPVNPEHTLQVGHTGTWTIVFHMADSLDGHVWGDGTAPDEWIIFGVVDNAPQADGINITWNAVLNQNPDMMP